jgi:hypothetical protein
LKGRISLFLLLLLLLILILILLLILILTEKVSSRSRSKSKSRIRRSVHYRPIQCTPTLTPCRPYFKPRHGARENWAAPRVGLCPAATSYQN